MKDPDRALIDERLRDREARVHFVGIGGAGMSALAHFRAEGGGRCSGSDRFFDRGELADDHAHCRRLGIEVFAQDGSGIDGSALVVASTAVEDSVPDLSRARKLGVPVVRRAEWLAGEIRHRPTIAIAGTSGKSTVVAMVFEALDAAGLDPGLITGGELNALAGRERRGNAKHGRGPLVVEADESDKSLVAYEPSIGVVLNLHRDHDEPEALLPVFDTFRRNCRDHFLVAHDPALASLRPASFTFGLESEADMAPTSLESGPRSTRISIAGCRFDLPIPGRHNAFNAIAALAACRAFGADLALCTRGLENYRGVARRYHCLGERRGVEVIDDFAHNPAKVAAMLRAARSRSARIHAIFQPHGFTQTRLLRDDYRQVFQTELRPEDRLHLLDIYFAGGTVTRNVSSADLVADLAGAPFEARVAPDRHALCALIATEVEAGDLVLLMGARDPSLGAFARQLIASL